MKKQKPAIFLHILCILPLLLCACAPQTASRDLFAMDTYMHLTAHGGNADAVLGLCAQRIAELEQTLSVTDETSDIWEINHADGKPVTISPDTASLLTAAQEIGEETGGALDISLYPVLSAWGFTQDTQQIPDAQTLADALELVDFRRITLDGDTVQLPAGMQLDLGALAKGYTGDCVLELLRENGVTSALVSLGGNVQALGTKPDGSRWTVAVQSPFDPAAQLCTVEIADAAVITSGSYERYFTDENGNSYHHILDPSDGFPADNGLVSVTVIGENGLRCDALSTALFVLGKEDAAQFWQEYGDFEMILVTQDGELSYTEGLCEMLTLPDGTDAEVIAHD